MKKNITIIGAGLSGLYAAFLLENEYNVIILEARERLGGRIYTKDNLYDMGPSWIWNHNFVLMDLINKLGLEIFEHYEEGFAYYDGINGVEKFNTPKQNNSYHIKGGMMQLILEIKKHLKNTKIFLNETVSMIQEEQNNLITISNQREYKSDYVISTLPPRLAINSIQFNPTINKDIARKMNNIPTWMGHTQKVLIKYARPFWRDEKLSGFVYSPLGPLHEIHDISEENTGILFGFAHAKTKIVEDDIVKQLERIFGKIGITFEEINIFNWGEEKYTSTQVDKEDNIKEHPLYGLDYTHFSDKLFFIGTETDTIAGGYLEGALNSALGLQEILRKL